MDRTAYHCRKPLPQCPNVNEESEEEKTIDEEQKPTDGRTVETLFT